MSTTAARVLLRRQLTRSQTGRINYEITRAGTITALYSSSALPICQQCCRSSVLLPITALPKLPLLGLPHNERAFHTSPAVAKKKAKEESSPKRGGGGGKSSSRSDESSSAGSDEDGGTKHPQPSPDEPLNFADVKSRLSRHAEHFRGALKKLQTGGRFDPDVIGGLIVTVDKKAGTSYPLRELAEVVPRVGGRAVSILAHETTYVKPILSAVQSSADFNQQPQRDPDNELELILKVEPDSRDDQVRRARALAHEWRERVRAVRQKRDKLHGTWKKEGAIVPDVKFSADKELEKVIKAAVDEINEAEKVAVKVAESK